MFGIDDAIMAGGLGALGNIGGGLLQNSNNWAIMQAQQGFQERMSSSAYQRSVADMKAAGLNPMLAFSQGGASTPPGGSTQSVNPFGGLSSTALESMKMKQVEADTRKSQAEADIEEGRADYADKNPEWFYSSGSGLTKGVGAVLGTGPSSAKSVVDKVADPIAGFLGRFMKPVENYKSKFKGHYSVGGDW